MAFIESQFIGVRALHPSMIGPCIDVEGRGFQHLPRDLANVNALKKHV